MATSVFIGNCSSSHDLENTRREMEMSLMNVPATEKSAARIHSGKSSGTGGGRRKSKVNESSAQKNKKAPQRGMGVEQLEKLRFQERIKKMTEINNPLHHPLSFQNQQFSTLPTTTAGYGAYSILNSGSGSGFGVGQMGFDDQHSALLLQGLGNGLVHHNNGPVVSSGVVGVGNLFSDHESSSSTFMGDPYGVGLGFRGPTETASKELSSIPNNLKWNSDQCGVCYKKFRGNGENLTCNGSERKMCGAGEISGFGNFAKGNMFAGGNPYYSSSKPTGQEVEVMAVHRKGMNTGGGGGSVLMEYEFFPGKVVGESYCNYKELMNLASSSKGVVEASEDFIDDGVAGEVGGASIDLSLKLSY